MTTDSSNPYDVAPYQSYCYEFTSPDHLHTIGRLFGMRPPDYRSARVLELGCASGGNIVPMAERFPKARFVGVDLSDRQIARAKALAATLALKNVDFHALSIAALPEDIGTFDYIIAHGFLSWVEPDIQAALWTLLARRLGPGGIALVSYNTLPGWHAARPVRDMLLYHCARFDSPADKVREASALLEFILAAAPQADESYRQLIRRELDLFRKADPSYLLHDHLEAANHQFYLHEAVAKLRAVGLEYLGDAHLPRMYRMNLPAKTAQSFSNAADVTVLEQYLDFLNNQRFRISLVVHKGTELNRSLDRARIREFHLASRLQPRDRVPIDLARDQAVPFEAPGWPGFTAQRRAAAALLLVLSERNGRPISAERLIAEAAALAKIRDHKSVAETLIDMGMPLALSGMLTLHAEETPDTGVVSSRPVGFRPARVLARDQAFVPTARLTTVRLDESQRRVLSMCDGTRDHAALQRESGAPAVGPLLAGLARDGFLIG